MLSKLKFFLYEKEFYGKEKFYAISVFCLFFVLPLILANVPYMDDYTRMDNGLGQWEYEGRPITTLLIDILNFNISPIYNIGPIPLIFGTLFFIYSVYYSTGKMDLKSNLVNILPFTLLACNPFFLQNLSYQFDSIGNLFSISFVLFSFFYSNKNKIKQYVIQLFFLISVSACYQPSSNVYIAFFILNSIFQFKKDRDSFLKSLVYHGSVYIISCLLYYLFSWLSFKYLYPEIAFRSNIISLNLNSLFFSYEYSIKDFFDLCRSFKSDKMMGVIFIAAGMFFINILFLVISVLIDKTKSIVSKTLISVFILLSPFLFFISLWGPFILLQELFFNPRDFPSIGVLFMGGAMSFYFVDKKGYLNSIFTVITLTSILSFSFVYGSVLKNDYNYKQYVYDSIAMNLEDHQNEINNKTINVYGRNTTSSFVRQALVEHNFIYRLIYPDNTNFFKKYNLNARNIQNIKGGFILDDLDEWKSICKNKISPMVSNSNYDIFNFKDHVSVWFKRSRSLCNDYPLETDIHFSRKQDAFNFYQK